jgi:hypothetical protein
VDPRLYPTEGNGITVTGTVGVNDLRGGGGKGQRKGKDIGAGVGLDDEGELTNVSVEVAPPPPPQEEVLSNVSVEVAPPAAAAAAKTSKQRKKDARHERKQQCGPRPMWQHERPQKEKLSMNEMIDKMEQEAVQRLAEKKAAHDEAVQLFVSEMEPDDQPDDQPQGSKWRNSAHQRRRSLIDMAANGDDLQGEVTRRLNREHVTFAGTVGVNDLRGGGGGKGQHKGKDIGAGVGMDDEGRLSDDLVDVTPRRRRISSAGPVVRAPPSKQAATAGTGCVAAPRA